jgi:hypothetical protein
VNLVTRSLRHGFDEQHARHQRQAGKVSFEDGRRGRDARLGTDGLVGKIETDDAVDQLKVLEAHTSVPVPTFVPLCSTLA